MVAGREGDDWVDNDRFDRDYKSKRKGKGSRGSFGLSSWRCQVDIEYRSLRRERLGLEMWIWRNQHIAQ